jgi:hypothetical protein
MPAGRAIALAVAVGLGVGLYFNLWFGWPTFLSVALGATMAVVLLLVATSLAHDPGEADAAWRAAAPDLAARERGTVGTRVDGERSEDHRPEPEA